MADLLSDKLNLLILRDICFGRGLEVNLTYLSKRLKRHRNTIRERVRDLLSHRIVDRPVVPFGLFKEYPLLVVVYADLPDDEKVMRWIREDKNIFGAFRVREGEYNMMLFEFHKDVLGYHVWRDSLVGGGKIPGREERAPSNALYFSNSLIIKYEPSVGINLIEEEFKRKGRIESDGYVIDRLALNVLKLLLNGDGIKVNESFLSKRLGVHRSTIRKRILKMQQEGLILRPLCRFPLFFVPLNLLLVFSMVEVRKAQKQFMQDILIDPHVSFAFKISEGRYNLLLFECHLSIEDYLKWEEMYENKYPGCFGSIKNNYLSPRMTISIDQQKVSLGLIEERLNQLELK